MKKWTTANIAKASGRVFTDKEGNRVAVILVSSGFSIIRNLNGFKDHRRGMSATNTAAFLNNSGIPAEDD